MKVDVKIYGKAETVEASPDFWLKMLTACREAACFNYNMAHEFNAVVEDYVRLHNEIFEQAIDEILKMED